ncbi:unnamed protein product [Mytilus coruscus]|uniref:Peptidase aspartic putative domain-containing protein n=1 Tax=Mytilus coruscus TaxID=42192 RepID=A0A6J8AWR1_MYTCO|nr:unnamed protein product [Mytilus coruscus]
MGIWPSITQKSNVDAHIAVMKRERIWFNCLGRYKFADCKSTSRCKKCNKRHHTSICTKNDSVVESHEQVNKDNGETVLHCSLAPQKTSNVILKTAVASKSSGTPSTDANILLNEGAQRSFVTEARAKKLDIGINGTKIFHLSGFGEQNRQVWHIQSAMIYLKTDNGENIPLELLIIPEIALPLQIHMKSVVNMRYLRG